MLQPVNMIDSQFTAFTDWARGKQSNSWKEVLINIAKMSSTENTKYIAKSNQY